MEAGNKRHRIIVEQVVEGQDSFGDTHPNEVDDGQWTEFISRRASIRALVGSEALQDGQEQATATHWIEFRHGGGITAQMRVRFKDRIFDIKSVQNIDEIGREMRLLVEERS